MKKIIFFLTLLFLSLSISVYAADLTVTFTDENCVVSPSEESLFNELKLAPTNSITKTLEVKNEGTESANLAIDMVNVHEPGLIDWLSTVLDLKIYNQDTNEIILEGETMADWKTVF